MYRSSQKSGHDTVPKQTIMQGDKVAVATFWSIVVHADFHILATTGSLLEKVCVCPCV